MTEPVQTRDEPGVVVRARLEQMGVLAELDRLPGWQRGIVHDALDVARHRDRHDTDRTLAGARYLEEMAEVYERGGGKGPLVGILRRAATAHVVL